MKVGGMIRIAEAAEGPDRRYPSYAEIRDIALRMEATGFDAIWPADHLLCRRSYRSAA